MPVAYATMVGGPRLRNGLSGEGCRVHADVKGLDKVGRNDVALRDEDEVAAHQSSHSLAGAHPVGDEG